MIKYILLMMPIMKWTKNTITTNNINYETNDQ